MKPATYTVTVRGAGIHGFRRWLKAGLRTYGLKVTDAYGHTTAKVDAAEDSGVPPGCALTYNWPAVTALALKNIATLRAPIAEAINEVGQL